MEQTPIGPQQQNEAEHSAHMQHAHTEPAQNNSKKYKYTIGALSLLLVAGLATIAVGPELFLGDLSQRCNAIPDQEESAMVAMVDEANEILAQNSKALQIQKDLVSTHRDLNSNLGKSDLTESTNCEEGAAYVNEVLDLPNEYGICINQEEDISEFVAMMKDEDEFNNVKNNVVAFNNNHQQLAQLPENERQQVARLQQLLGSLNSFQAKATDSNYCDLSASVDLQQITAQTGDYLL